jgi:hypothetical protein
MIGINLIFINFPDILPVNHTTPKLTHSAGTFKGSFAYILIAPSGYLVVSVHLYSSMYIIIHVYAVVDAVVR